VQRAGSRVVGAGGAVVGLGEVRAAAVPAGGTAAVELAEELDGGISEADHFDGAADDGALVSGETVPRADGLAVVDEAVDVDAHAVAQALHAHLQHLDLPLSVDAAAAHPPLDVGQPPQLAGDADAGPPAGAHAAGREAREGVDAPPALLRDEVGASGSAAAALAGLAVHDDDVRGAVGAAAAAARPTRARARALPQPVAHARQHVRQQRERRRVVVWPWEVEDAVVHCAVGVACALRAEFPDCPVRAVLPRQEREELRERIAVRELRVFAAWS